jgi:hypothetical protein
MPNHLHFCAFLGLVILSASGCHQSAAQKQDKEKYEQNATASKATAIEQGSDKVKEGN